MSLLSVRGLDVDLQGRPVLQGIGFEARPGEVIGLIGPNGAGKTTLLRAICQLIGARSGEITWDDRSLADLDHRRRALTMAYLPQGHVIHWPMPVRRLVELGRLPRLGPLSRPAADDALAVDRAMAATDVAPFADRSTATLSGGEQARVLLARALAVEAPILLADEPAASLDPRHALEIMEVLRRTADQGRLVIAVMHELALVARFCDRVVLIDRGRLVADGPTRRVLTPDRLRDVYRIELAETADEALSFAAKLATVRRASI